MEPLPPNCPDDLRADFEQLEDVNQLDTHGRSPLYRAAMSGNCDLVAWCLDQKAKTNIKYKLTGETPLIAAVRAKHLDVALLLVERGANPNLKGRYGETALLSAANQGETALVKALLDKKAKILPATAKLDRKTGLHFACEHGHTDIVRLLVDAGADVNLADSGGEAPLGLAARSWRRRSDEEILVVFDLLLAKGADVNHQSKGGYTALLWCSMAGLKQCVKRLLDRGADPSLATKKRERPFDVAGRFGGVSESDKNEVLRLLAEVGAQPRH